MSKEDGGPAFPRPYSGNDNGYQAFEQDGMSLRAYAAIHLRVPNSEIDWLDEMIREANGQQRQLFTKKPGEPQFSTPDYYDGNWHDWHGGECPVPGAIVELHFRDDKWPINGEHDADDMFWGRFQDPEESEAEIIRFRVVKP